MLQEIGKEETSPSFGSLRFPKLPIFVEMFSPNLRRPIWSRHVGGALCGTYFGYQGNWLSELNQQTFTQALFLTLQLLKRLEINR